MVISCRILNITNQILEEIEILNAIKNDIEVKTVELILKKGKLPDWWIFKRKTFVMFFLICK